jgi:hypothetical protein
MTRRAEWRTGTAGDVVLIVDERSRVTSARAATTPLLSNFLTSMSDIETDAGALPLDGRAPDEWGDEVLTRAFTGEVLSVDPELLWDRIYRLFRSRGVDYDSDVDAAVRAVFNP